MEEAQVTFQVYAVRCFSVRLWITSLVGERAVVFLIAKEEAQVTVTGCWLSFWTSQVQGLTRRRRSLWDVVRSNKAGRGVLLTTHSMEEAQVILVSGVCELLLVDWVVRSNKAGRGVLTTRSMEEAQVTVAEDSSIQSHITSITAFSLCAAARLSL
jgi:hypothetical protein